MQGLSKIALQELRKRILADLRGHERAAADLKSVLLDLDAAERLFGRIEAASQHPSIQTPGFSELPYSVSNPFRQGSIRAVIWEVLKSSANAWLTTEAVRQEASKIMKRDLSLSSVGVSLSRMKPRICRRGFEVAIVSRILDDEP